MLISVCKFRKGEINYLNSDATWHTLLTVTAYSQTPASVHKFLPIVTLGDSDDKGIPWGATIPDKHGNYYYTSFSPAAYVLPFMFFKAFRLPATESSLYVFNSVLYALSAVLWFLFLCQIFSDKDRDFAIPFLGTLVYMCSPELFHGMGIVYWSQSVFQVTFIAQLLLYHAYRFENSKRASAPFYLLCVLNPYIEWSGFVANVGFALSEFALHWKKGRKSAICALIQITVLTAASFTIFTFHYLLAVDARRFFKTVVARFFARNMTTSVPIASLISGYFDSFKWQWVFLGGISVFAIIQNGSLTFKNKTMLFLSLFPVLENFIMKQHAISYSYDRMKFAFFLSFLSCSLMVECRAACKKKALCTAVLFVTAITCSSFNLKSYQHNKKFIWKTDYRGTNETFASYINSLFADSVLEVEGYSVRGYTNLLFGRGIYEWCNRDSLLEIAKTKGKRFVVILKTSGGAWNLYQFTSAEIIDVQNGSSFIVSTDSIKSESK